MRFDLLAIRQYDTRDLPATQLQSCDLAFDDRQTGLGSQHALDRRLEQLTIGLNPWPTDRGALARVEHAIVDARLIGSTRNKTIERVHFADEMAFADPTYRRVAGHGADRIRRKTDECDTSAASRRSGGGFTPGMPPTHNNDIEPNHDAP